MSKPTAILAINSGSSSIKFALYEMGRGRENLLARGAAEGIGTAGGRLWLDGGSDRSAKPVNQRLASHSEAIGAVLAALNRDKHPQPAAVGHRLVNGGAKHMQPERVSRDLIRKLQKVIPLAPLHLPTELAMIAAISSALPRTPQVACFDTAFHRTMPAIARHLPLPRALWRGGLQRYGFHGLSYEYIVSALGRAARGRRVIVAHLGNGASLAAIRHGRSVETTMGFTPTGGVIMGTRTGDLDPSVLLYLMREKRWGPARFERLVDHESGLLGISGTTSDMKALLARRSRDFRAREAVDMFCYSVRKQIGALAAVLGGCDSLVFTGGIGERAAPVRSEICRGLGYLGVRVAKDRNAVHAAVISPHGSACTVRVIPTNEELVIARHTYHLTSR